MRSNELQKGIPNSLNDTRKRPIKDKENADKLQNIRSLHPYVYFDTV